MIRGTELEAATSGPGRTGGIEKAPFEPGPQWRRGRAAMLLSAKCKYADVPFVAKAIMIFSSELKLKIHP